MSEETIKNKPKNADMYSWSRFVEMCEDVGVDIFGELEDWIRWWQFWRAGYCAASSVRRIKDGEG